MVSAISLNKVRKNFGSFTAISEVSFDIDDNEFSRCWDHRVAEKRPCSV